MAMNDENFRPASAATSSNSTPDAPTPAAPAVEGTAGLKRKGSALTRPPRKKPTLKSDPYEYRGRHFGRAVHAFINVAVLMTNGLTIARDIATGATQIHLLDNSDRREYDIYKKMLKMFPDVETGIKEGTVTISDLISIGNSVQRGAAASRADDVKGIKSAIVEWIAHPTDGLKPPIPRNSMHGRGWNHDATGRMLVPAGMDWNAVKSQLRDGTLVVTGDQWPIFLYHESAYDPEDPWNGLLKGQLVQNGYRHIFTSPSSVNHDQRATRAGNARLHGMEKVTAASLVYTATLVRFALSNANCFNRSDSATDSENFYTSLYNFITDPEERDNLTALLEWWDKIIFPSHRKTAIAPKENSALARLLQARERRRALAPATSTTTNNATPNTAS